MRRLDSEPRSLETVVDDDLQCRRRLGDADECLVGHILQADRRASGVDPAKVFAILPNEVREIVDLYLNGKIDQWYSLQDRRGVVFILNVTDPAAAHEMLEKLPLGQAHLMSFELIPLGPLNPLRWLQGMKENP
jgi:hypothetical protein